MGIGCSCDDPCVRSWGCILHKLQTSAELRRVHRNCRCGTVRRRVRFLRIRRRRRRLAQECTCSHKIGCCAQEFPSNVCESERPSPESPPVKNVCRFTVDAYFT